MTIKAIETKYAGCHFRSRLEARYAALFNHLGIAWEYEPQGYEVNNRLRLDGAPDTFNYLPDFWLPGLQVWFEVKGELDDTATRRLLNAAASLSSNNGGGCGGGHDLLVGGPLTSSGVVGTHPCAYTCTRVTCSPPADGADTCEGIVSGAASTLLRGYACNLHMTDRRILAAFDAARTARFEFGRKPKNVGVVVP